MIRWLRFSPHELDAAGRAVAMATFEERATIRPETICALGVQARERLVAAFGTAFTMDVFDVGVPSAGGWERLQREAWRWAIVGGTIAACILIGRRDARRLAAAAFGEIDEGSGARGLSDLERGALQRIAASVAEAFAPLFGGMSDVRACGNAQTLRSCRAFVQLRLGAPINASVCVALAEEPATPVSAGISFRDIDDLALACEVEVPLGELSGAQVAALAVGSIVPFDTKVGPRAALKVAGQNLASGECGSLGSSMAFLVRTLPMIGVTS